MYDIRSGVLICIYQLQRRVNSNNENPSSREFLCEKSTSCNISSSSMLCNDELTLTWICRDFDAGLLCINDGTMNIKLGLIGHIWINLD